MVDENSEPDLDMFGFPIPRPRGRGRPAFEWSEKKARQVSNLLADNATLKFTAEVMGCDVKTLRLNFSREIACRHILKVRRKMVVILQLQDDSAKGNVGASKALLKVYERAEMRAVSDAFGDKPKAAPRKGVKEERREAAWDAGREDDGWGPLLHGETGQHLPN